MTDSDKIGLKWNDFQNNLVGSFGGLRQSLEFSDVTLASEDGHQVEAHRFVLSAGCGFFNDLFKNIRHSHPFVFMKGLKTKEPFYY